MVDAVWTESRAWRVRLAPAHAACPVPFTPLASTGSAARAGCTCLISRGETGPGAHLAGLPVSIRPVRVAATTG
jgi:hypothetical protein